MRSPGRQEDQTTIQQLEAQQAQLKEELASLEAQLTRLRIREAKKKPVPLRNLFPKGTTVRVINTRDNANLYNTEARVTDHTPKRIWIRTSDNKKYLRAPDSLELVHNG